MSTERLQGLCYCWSLDYCICFSLLLFFPPCIIKKRKKWDWGTVRTTRQPCREQDKNLHNSRVELVEISESSEAKHQFQNRLHHIQPSFSGDCRHGQWKTEAEQFLNQCSIYECLLWAAQFCNRANSHFAWNVHNSFGAYCYCVKPLLWTFMAAKVLLEWNSLKKKSKD